MASVQPDVMAAVRRKLNVTWEDEDTDRRIRDVVAAVSPRLGARLALGDYHRFCEGDGQAWGLFLNACLYEFSDALDDFWRNYAAELDSVRMANVMYAMGADAGASDLEA